MSIVKEIFMNRQIAKAAEALDIVEAGQKNTIAKAAEGATAQERARVARKYHLLAKVMKDAMDRFNKLVEGQSVYSKDEFFMKAYERMSEIRAERALVAKHKREKREAEAAERAAIQSGGELAA